MDSELKLQLLMLGFWLFIIYQSYRSFFQSLRSTSWPIFKATVITSSFDRNGGVYSPKIIYRYKISNIEYQNDTYTYLGNSGSTKLGSINISKKYPEGAEINIYVDPNNSQNSVILPGLHWSYIAVFFMLTVFCLCVAFLGPILNFFFPGCEPNCS